MPTAPPKPCSVPGCRNLTAARYCARHEKSERREADQRRGSSSQRGYTSEWQRFRKQFSGIVPPVCVGKKPNNEVCGAALEPKRMHLDHNPALTPAERLDPVKVCDPNRVQWLCDSCHRTKTIREDGGFGRTKAVAHVGS